MGQVPDHIVARRARSRARRRRRRAAALGGMLLVLIAAILFGVESGGGAAKHKRPGVATPRAATATAARPAQRVSALDARGNATIRKLAALALPVYCGGPRGRELAFTFDDGPGVYTHYALEKLAQAHERATFFVVGRAIQAWPGWIRRELKVAALGDHTFTHSDLLEMPSTEVASELETDRQLIVRESGQSVDLFRPPYGAQDRAVNRVASRLGLLDIMWSMDSRDSLGAGWAGIIKHIESDLRPGAIILMHENRGQTIRALTRLLPLLHKRHLRSVSLPELFATDPPTPEQIRRGLPACLGHPAGPGELAGAA
jgi:peptidoglycan-N-acetylglucosamine deacetylase